MWLFDAITSGFLFATEEWRLQCFRILLGLACFLKFAVALTHGGFDRLTSGTLGRYELCRKFGPSRGKLLSRVHRPLLVVRLLASAILMFGVVPKLAICVVAIGLLHELTYAYRFNTIYLCILALCLLPAGNLGLGLALSTATSPANTWSQILVVLITVNLYWNSAWQKIRSRQFTSGLLLAQFVHFVGQIQDRTRYREFFYPRWLLQHLGRLDDTSIARWRVLSGAVIVLELVLPLALFFPSTYLVAVAVGAAMHLCFTGLLPRQLLGFSVATTGSYLLFVP